MPKNLVIVESPAKAKTIEGYLGKDFKVLSSYGHIRDLAQGGMSIDIENNFTPQYEITAANKLVAELKREVKSADTIWLATDEDREGEAISWHLYEALNLKNKDTKRIAFNEITKSAVLNAIENPREIDKDLVDAQQARRILDRLVGFELSPLLWRRVKPGLSAGRVQSIAVRLLVEREREINAFVTENFFRVKGKFAEDGKKIEATLSKDINNTKNVEAFLEDCKKGTFKVTDVTKTPGTRNPSAPFTTSTLQQEASLKLGYSVSRTMRVAQSLYESGHITYMRTDSVNLSQTAIDAAKESIVKNYGSEFSKPRNYQNKNKGAQEAHEAIRPSEFKISAIKGNKDEQKLYDLIWKRSIASQMSPAKLERTTIRISNGIIKDEFVAKGEVIKFEGFLKVYLESKLDDEEDDKGIEGLLPDLKKGAELDTSSIIAQERYTRSPARYVEASLVKKLEELGIGRPSTYAPTIDTIQNRGYVEKLQREGMEREYQIYTLKGDKVTTSMGTETTGKESNKLSPTDIGLVVTDFLVEHFGEILNYNFTAKVEQEFDEIAQGLKEWTQMIHSFYNPFHEAIEYTLEHSEHVSGERFLGDHPETGEQVIVRIGKFGPLAQIGETTEDNKPKFASLGAQQSIETITLEEALELFKIPFDLEEYEGEPITVATGRYGAYIKWGATNISLPRSEDPLSVDQERAIELIEEKKKADAPVGTYNDEPITKGVGRFGPFLKWKDMYVNVPKKYDFDNLTLAEMEELISLKVEKEANRYILKFPEEKITVENGRWGPFIRVNKKSVNPGKKKDGERYTAEDFEAMTLDEIKKMVKDINPSALPKAKKKAAAKKTAAKKTVKKKPVAKKTTKTTAKTEKKK